MGCSSSCCTAPLHRYTERHGARMLTQAASFFSTRSSASRSAAARSGRLVNTSSVLMAKSFSHGWVTQPIAQGLLHAPVVEPARFAHEAQELRGNALLDLAARQARGAGQSASVGDQIEPLAHTQFTVVARVVDARGGVV